MKYFVYVDGPNGGVSGPYEGRNEFMNRCTEYGFDTMKEAELFRDQQRQYFLGLEEKMQAERNEKEGNLKKGFCGGL